MRIDGRTPSQMRPMRFVPHFLKNAHGSVLVEFGDTKVICAVTMEENVPHFLRNVSPAQGWLTAEYSMLPAATGSRTKRERPQVSGRTQEIQRLIGRSLRGIVDLTCCPDMTFTIDCDVIQADGGTRTAAITGSYVALRLAFDKLIRSGKLKRNPLKDGVAAVSIGLYQGEPLVDLNYSEDSQADVDMNVVMTHSKRLLEVQGTAERASFSRQDMNRFLEIAEEALIPVFDGQNTAAEGREVEL